MDAGSMKRHAFISYVHEDAAEVDRLEAFLEAAGIPVWRDRSDLWPGEDWKLKIHEAIVRDSLAFIACFSQHLPSREVSYQYEELLLAAEQYRQRPPDRPWLFPVRFTDCKLPHLDLGPSRTLDSLHRVDLFGDDEAWEAGSTKLLTSLRRMFPNPDQQVPARPAAVRPGTVERRRAARAAASARPPIAVQGHPLDILQPSNLHTPAGQTTDIVMRCAVVFPRCRHIPARGNGVVSVITGTPRENAIAGQLDQSELTAWFARQADGFHLAAIPGWHPHGPNNAGDNSHLVIQPRDDDGAPGPLAGICQVNTGWVAPEDGNGEPEPGLQLMIDLTIRVLEYDADRRPSQIRHATTPPPAPAAVPLELLFDGLVALLDTAQIAQALSSDLLGGDPPGTGHLVCWLTTHGGPRLDQLIDLTHLRVIPGSGSGAHQVITEDLPLGDDPPAIASLVARRSVAYRLLGDVLQYSGFRDYEAHLDALRDDERHC